MEIAMSVSITPVQYTGGSPVSFSFDLDSTYTNLNITAASAATGVLDTEVIILSISVYARVGVNHAATIADPIISPGMWALKVPRNCTLALLRAGTADGAATIFIPK